MSNSYENEKIYAGRGTPEMFDDYVDFINYVFGFNGNGSDFKKLLPKLYQYKYEPAVHSYVVTEDGKLKSAIGAFDHDLCVCGEVLKTRGIGNVAVHPYSRSKGYMKQLMNMALDDMVKDGVVLSALGGRRQRYRYFSYDKLGPKYSFSVNSDNIRHSFGDSESIFTFKRVKAEDKDILDSIKKLSSSQNLYATRDNADYYEILVSWQQSVHAAYLDGKFAGYMVEKDCEVSELLLEDEYIPKLREFIRDAFRYLGRGKLGFKLPVHLPEYLKLVQDIPEGISFEPCKSFSVLNYKAVVGAFMKLKATYEKMPDGKLVLNINGRGGNENIALTVKNGVPSCEYTEEKADMKFEHIEAMNLLFGLCCPERDMLPDFARIWLPLPLFVYYSDTV